jgi:signal transduction histidine kinase
MVFGIIPECRSASLRKERSASPEYPRPRQKAITLKWEDVQERSVAATRLGKKKPTCGAFEFEFRAWDIGSDDTREIAEHFETAKGSIRKAIRVHKGISVYRDNILVLPKSEQARDWLGLDLRRVSRVGTRLSTSQIVGYVSITAESNPNIEDTSDRERLAQNPSVLMFEEILKTIASVLEEERDEDRRKPNEETRLEALLDGVNADELVEEMTSFAEDGIVTDEVVLRTKAHNARLETVRETIKKRLVYYSRLATVGTIAQMLVHEIRNRTTSIARFIRLSRKHFADNAGDLALPLGHAEGAITALESLADTFAPLANRSFRRGRRDTGLEESLGRCISLLETQIKDAKVSVSWPQAGATRVAVDPGELDAIALNLLDNAIYWLSKSRDSRKLDVAIRKLTDGKRVRVTISDSGPGVAEDDEDKIFLPGVTRKPGGIGMGLTVAAELISDHGGRISLVQPGKLGGATFSFDLPLKLGLMN